MIIQKLNSDLFDDGAALANRVFLAQVMQSYPDEGKANMMRYMAQKSDILALQCERGERCAFGCFEDDKLLGFMVYTYPNLISLLYVDTRQQGRGIGKNLMAYAAGYAVGLGQKVLHVNSSDFGLPFYQRCGFVPTGFRTVNDGVVYTPMKRLL